MCFHLFVIFWSAFVPPSAARCDAMGPFRLNDILTAVQGETRCWHSGEIVRSISTDSRTLRPGELFWALRGERHDGHAYLPQALANGALGAVVQTTESLPREAPLIVVNDTSRALSDFAAAHRLRSDALLIGVTGSFGKTTTREMIFAALSAEFTGLRSPRNYNNHLGVPLTLLQLHNEHEFAVVELAASAVGEIAALAEIVEPEIAVLTGIGPAHLSGFGSVENIVRTKAELLQFLPETGFAVLAGDDVSLRSLATEISSRVVLAGEGEHNDWQADNIRTEQNRLVFEVERQTYSLPVIGRHCVRAAVAAIAVGREIGLSPAVLADGLAAFQPPPGRCRWLPCGAWNVIDDTYNANPASFAAACAVLQERAGKGNRILVAGEMRELGAASASYHHQLGQLAAQSDIDRLVAYGDEAKHIMAGAQDGGLQSWQLAECRTLESLQTVLSCWLHPGDVVLVKGSRALRMERVVAWLQNEGEKTFKENMSRRRLRACA